MHIRSTICILVILFSCTVLTAQRDQRFVFTLSDPDEPMSLAFDHGTCGIRVTGYEGDKVEVMLFKRGKAVDPGNRAVSFTERNNRWC